MYESFRRNGDGFLVSYRDPNLEKHWKYSERQVILSVPLMQMKEK